MARLEGGVAMVTGAAGFVGPYVAAALRDRGVRVHGLGNEPRENLPLESWRTVDLLDGDGLADALGAVCPDRVVHLAGQSSAGRSFEQPVETFEVNALGTYRLLEAARRAAPRARILVVGSGEVYGPQPQGSRVTEQAPLRPVSPYALSKAAADAFAEVAASAHGLDVVRARSFSHTGPGQRPEFAIPSWAQELAAIEAGRAEPRLRVGNLEVTRDLSDVRDVARGYLLLLERGSSGAAYNVCRGVGVKLSEVVQRLAGRCRVRVHIEVDPARVRPADVPFLVGDPSTIARDTGWRAEIPLDQTLDDVLHEWRGRASQSGP
jgi:GDP-4-dehydro-6-deoxy-D-mannose reductase